MVHIRSLGYFFGSRKDPSGIFTYHRIRIAAFQEEVESSDLEVRQFEGTSGSMDLGTHGKQHHDIILKRQDPRLVNVLKSHSLTLESGQTPKQSQKLFASHQAED